MRAVMNTQQQRLKNRNLVILVCQFSAKIRKKAHICAKNKEFLVEGLNFLLAITSEE